MYAHFLLAIECVSSRFLEFLWRSCVLYWWMCCMETVGTKVVVCGSVIGKDEGGSRAGGGFECG